jgi:hypothetical protein
MGRTSRWLELAAAEYAYLAGDWKRSEALLPEAGRRSMGFTYVNETLRRIDLALGKGEHDRARAMAEDVADMAESSREPQWIGPAAVQRAELERRAGDLDAARRAIDEGLDRIEYCSEDVARISLLAAMGVRIEADAALRARDLADADAERLARRRTEDLLLRLEAIAADTRPVETANLRCAQADASRVTGMEDPSAYAAAADAWTALGRPYAAADARWRQAEALLARADRDAAAAVARQALDAAQAIGATWLASEIEGFAARARLRLDAAGRSPSRPTRRAPTRTPSASRRGSVRCSSSWPRGAPTARSARPCSWPRRPPASTSRGSSPSSTCARGPRRAAVAHRLGLA